MTAGRSCIVVGSGPNGLAAAVTLARAGWRVTVLEAEDSIGGGARSAALTLPGFTHDVCSAIHPMGIASPCFRTMPLDQFGLEWIHPPAPLAHPLEDGGAVMLHRSIAETAAGLGGDGSSYARLMTPLVHHHETLLDAMLAPLIPPRRPIALARFGWHAMRSARGLAERRFGGARARALFAGIAAHAFLPLEAPFSASFGLALGLVGHAAGWPLPRGGSGAIAAALAGYLQSLGGEIVTSHRVTSAAELAHADTVLFDVTPRQLLDIGGTRLPARYRRRLSRYRYGPAVFKLDWALDGPIPWRAPDCALAGTVHLGGTLDEISASERAVSDGAVSPRPFVLLTQSSLFDPSRAPAGQHTAWAYCHVPNGAVADMTTPIEDQVERFAPGFRDRILARHAMTPATIEQHNANCIGGDIAGGANDAWQIFARPVAALDPYTIPVQGWYLCSASTPPGGGVHGMSGFNAATAALRAAR